MTFRYAQGGEPLDWHFLCAVDPRRLFPEGKVDAPLLQRILETLAFGRVSRDDAAMLTPDHVSHLFQLSQILLQYVTYSQERLVSANSALSSRLHAAESALEETKGRLQASQEEVKEMGKDLKAQKRTLMALEFERASRPPSKHHPEGAFRCSQCSEAYASAQSLESHIRKRHGVPPAMLQPQAPPNGQSQEFLHLQTQLADLRAQLQFERERQLKSMQPAPSQSPSTVTDFAALMTAASRFGVAQIPAGVGSTGVLSDPMAARLEQIEKSLAKVVESMSYARVEGPAATKVTGDNPVAALGADASGALPKSPAISGVAKPPAKIAAKKPWQRVSADAANSDEIMVAVPSSKPPIARADSFESLSKSVPKVEVGGSVSDPAQGSSVTGTGLEPVEGTLKESAAPAHPLTSDQPSAPVNVLAKQSSLNGSISGLGQGMPQGPVVVVSSAPAQSLPETSSSAIAVLDQSAKAGPTSAMGLIPSNVGGSKASTPTPDFLSSRNDLAHVAETGASKPGVFVGPQSLASSVGPIPAPPNVRVLDESSILSHPVDALQPPSVVGGSVAVVDALAPPTPSSVKGSNPLQLMGGGGSLPKKDGSMSIATDILDASQQIQKVDALPPGFELAGAIASTAKIPTPTTKRRSPTPTSSTSSTSSRSYSSRSTDSSEYDRRRRRTSRARRDSYSDSYSSRRRRSSRR